MKTLTKAILAVMLSLFMFNCLLSIANAAVPRLINYQGKLTDASGAPLNGTYTVTFRIYDAESGPGTIGWEETYDNLEVKKGVFSVLLGSKTNFNTLTFNGQYYLGIKVGDDAFMEPRQKITSAAYAISAEKAERAEAVTGAVSATGGLVIETRTSDPASPATGQLWLRTDL